MKQWSSISQSLMDEGSHVLKHLRFGSTFRHDSRSKQPYS